MSKLSKAMSVLRTFSTTTPQLSVTGVAEALGLPKSSVSRLMKEMREQDLLEQDPESRLYRPGFFLYQLGMIYETHLDIFELVLSQVDRLVRSTGHTGYIGILDKGDMLSLRTIQGRHPIRYVLGAGQRLPAYTITGGKCLLSRLPDSKVAELYPGEFDPRYPRAPRSLDGLLRELREIRELGWAETVVSSLPGVRAIGVSIASADGKEAFGYSLSYPDGFLSPDEIVELREKLVNSAHTLAVQTGDRYWTGRSIKPGVLSAAKRGVDEL